MIKAIFFDFDGVLTNFEYGSYTVCYNLSQKTGIPTDKLVSCYHQHTGGLDIGKIEDKDFWGAFCRCVGCEIGITLLDYAFRNVSMNEKMLELAKKLRKNYKVGIITDNSKGRFNAIIDEFKLRDIFDALILSADVGATKKEEVIFRRALDSLKLKPQECIFIDNSARNLEVPKRMGFKTIHYDFQKKDFDSLLTQLKTLIRI
ncbi:Glyceraldehyde 3-phosphate phosphatase [uncultured archaeon]|nr:Glyceraldehyde 3-phosphate phosphatase [uncultured archaeon]